MPILIAFEFVLLLLTKFFIKIVIVVFGWTTEIFFGRFLDKWKTTLYIMIVLSFVWMIFALSYVFPTIPNILSGYIPEKANMLWSGIIVFGLVAIPPVVGAICAKIKGVNIRNAKNLVLWLLKGYRISVRLGISVSAMLICTVIIRFKRFMRRAVAENMYLHCECREGFYIMDRIIASLNKEGIGCEKRKSSAIYSVPYVMFKDLFQDIFGKSATREMYIAGEDINIYLNLNDIMLEGESEVVEKAKKTIVKYSIDTDLFLTEYAKETENKIKKLLKEWEKGGGDNYHYVKEISIILKEANDKSINYNEWSVLMAQICAVYERFLDKNMGFEK